MQVKVVTDPLGDRMKKYEVATRTILPSKQFYILRLDGRSFHTYTRGLDRPDPGMLEAMLSITKAACEEISGSIFGMTHSDEVSILFSDRGKENTQLWFGGQIQKIASVGASLVTGHFNRYFPDRPLAMFDARVFSLPSEVEVANYYFWRQSDARRNGISDTASQIFSAKQLHGKTTEERRQMLTEAGVNPAEIDPRFLHGQAVYRVEKTGQVEYIHKRSGEKCLSPIVTRRVWESGVAPDLTAQQDGFMMKHLPTT